MSGPFLVGLIGARGFAGRELVRLIAGHPHLMLAYAVSRRYAGRRVSEIAPEDCDECVFEWLEPDEAAVRRADVVMLAAPDGAAKPYADAIDRLAPHRIVIDLSADHRFDDDWAYGLPELRRDAIRGATRIANPGCYATAMQLAIAPLAGLADGPVSVFGVSGYSGAGSTPSPRNDVALLQDNLAPYALTGHKHEREAARHLASPVRFTPSVHPAFRGLTTVAHIPLTDGLGQEAIRALFEQKYRDEPLIALQNEPPTLKQGAYQNGAILGGFDPGKDGRHAVVVASIDNLLKGAAAQAVQNANLALGLGEMDGLSAVNETTN